MDIKWFGQSCFEIKNKNVTVITDPYNDDIGLKLPKLKANIVTVSHNHYDHNNVARVEKANPGKEVFVADTPGGDEVEGVLIEGISTFHDDKKGAGLGLNTIFEMKINGLTVCHLGDLGVSLTDEQVDNLDDIDILFVPVGGTYTLDAKGAVEVIEQIEPRMVIPMHYKTEGLNIKELEGVEKFIKELGVDAEKMDSLKIEKKDLPQEGMRLVILNKV